MVTMKKNRNRKGQDKSCTRERKMGACGTGEEKKNARALEKTSRKCRSERALRDKTTEFRKENIHERIQRVPQETRDALEPFLASESVRIFSSPPSPLSLRFRRKKTQSKNQRTGTSARKLHLITAQVRVRFVHGVGFLFSFSFTHDK